MPGLISENDIDRVREAVDIAQVIGDYLTLKRKAQGDYWGLCPFHTEKTSSFHVRSDRGIFHCFGCGKGGNVFTFLMEVAGISFTEAVKLCADRVGIEIEQKQSSPEAVQARTERERLFHANSFASKWFHRRLFPAGDSEKLSPEAKKAKKYLKERGLSEETIDRFQIGWTELAPDNLVRAAATAGIGGHTLAQAGLARRQAGGNGYVDRFRGRVIFPIISLTGKTIAFGARRVEGITPTEDDAKYINTSETVVYIKGEHLYGLNIARDAVRREGRVYLVEGYTDLLAMVRAGIENTAASLGTALTVSQGNLLRRFTSSVHIIYDADSAGVSAAVRGADLLTRIGMEVRMILLPKGEDPDTLLTSGGVDKLRAVLEGDLSFVEFRLKSVGVVRDMSSSELMRTAGGLIETIQNLENPIQRDILVKELSTATGITPTAIYTSMKGASKYPSGETDEVQKQLLNKNPEHAPEFGLIKEIIGHPELTGECLTDVKVEMITHPGLKLLYLQIEKSYLRNGKVDISVLPEKTKDSALRAFIAEAAIWGESVSQESARNAVNECRQKLIGRELKGLKTTLELEINEARRKGLNYRELYKKRIEIVNKIQEMGGN